MDESAIIRLVEHHGTAALRALSGTHQVTYRHQGISVDGKRLIFESPYLFVDPVKHELVRNRGVVDALSMRLRHTDWALHKSNKPDTLIEILIFDILEQLRCESLADSRMTGLIGNMNQAFSLWCVEFQVNGHTETEFGLMLFTLIYIVRLRITNISPDSEIEGLIESMRFNLAPLIGANLVGLKQSRSSQLEYAKHALSIASSILKFMELSGMHSIEQEISALREKRLLPPESIDNEDLDTTDFVESLYRGTDADQEYSIFCSEYDQTIPSKKLYRLGQRMKLRQQLDQLIAAQSVNLPKLAQRLRIVFGTPTRSGWNEGFEDGYIDGRRISQLIANPAYSRIFKQEKLALQSNSIVTFLIDNSGSMRRKKYEALAVLIDVLCRALEIAGVKTEILGFSTGGWAGGQSIRVWRKCGSPQKPGRLNDRLHIIYKDAETDWKQARLNIATMLNPAHFREGLDGEALQWAFNRLQERSESRKCLIFISDGAPMETATNNHNSPSYLDSHLRNVAKAIERTETVELRGIATAFSLVDYLSTWTPIDFSGTLDTRAFHVLERIFEANRSAEIN
ncbi:MAG: hypothetical protein OXE41_10765 [Gammaproteobacteria bacterium]|nr:hypothetical protein [Gammaproteobacteria bacterium]MCY4275856.1 hypothetical protein [Gammaproteobacteria bacterium]